MQRILLVCTLSILILPLLNIPISSHKLFALSYVESSNGLIPPTLEGGRTELELADINQDGNLDILSIGDHGNPYVNSTEHGIIVWFGDGSGNWSSSMTGNFGYGGIAVGDVNNDGFYDVGYGMHHNWGSGDFGDQLLEVALGDGTGTSWTPWDDGLASNGEDWGMFATDFSDVDNDGDLDVGSISFGCCAGVHVYLNNGDGTWTQSWGFLGGNSDMLFYFCDIDGDGNSDIVVSHQYGTVYLGDGSGNFSLGDGNLPPSGMIGRLGVSPGDVNNDGKDDISFVNDQGGVEVWVYQGDLQWEDFSSGLPSSGPYYLTQIYDMNIDGNNDLIAGGEGVLTIWLGDGNGNWVEDTSFYTPNAPSGFQALRVGGDADHNGFPDIVFVTEEGSWPNYQNHIHFFKESSTPESLFIKPIRPGVNQSWYDGSVHFIDWVSGVPNQENSWVKLEISLNGPSGPYQTIIDSIPNNGRFQWLLDVGSGSDSAYIRYTVVTVNDTSWAIGGPFRIIERFLCGDANGDGEIGPLDLNYLGNYVFFGGPPPDPLVSGDANGDCTIDQLDILYLAYYLFYSGPQPQCCPEASK